MPTRTGRTDRERRGSILPLVTVSLVALVGVVALAIDLGMMALARNHCQNAADAAAMAGARTLNGDVSDVANPNNKNNAAANATAAATANDVLSQPITSDRVTATVGKYYYNRTAASFVAWPTDAGSADDANEPWTLCTATVRFTNGRTFFSNVFRMLPSAVVTTAYTSTATATAVHRPRDVVMITDYSGSMRFDSLLGGGYNGARSRSQNNEAAFPRFGHYSDQTTAALRSADPLPDLGGSVYGQANITLATNSGPAIVNDFFRDANNLDATLPAFTPAATTLETTPGGDVPLRSGNNNAANAYAKTVADITGSATTVNANWESAGYTSNSLNPKPAAFNGYTQGPNYWGKTFFIWPPDPRTPAGTDPAAGGYVAGDWRKRFFFATDGTTPLNDNTKLFDSAGDIRVPRSSSTNNYYRINYNAILQWIRNCGPNPFPSRLQAGGVLYYDAIPTAINNGAFPPVNANERFWKEYIDHVIGVEQSNGTPTYSNINSENGYGPDYAWGTVAVTAKPADRYMSYSDNPKRPRTRLWFGPMTMIDFLGNYNAGRFWWPGTAHESPIYQCKLGLQAAIRDIQLNHPNDNATTLAFSTPKYAYNDGGAHNRAKVPLGRDYSRMIDTLWFAPQTIDAPTTPIRPYDAAMSDVPRSNGGTCYAMPLMAAYNQLSGEPSLRTYSTTGPAGEAGGFGRRGSQRLIIFETDGVVNAAASGGFFNNGACKSWYSVRLRDYTSNAANEYPTNSGTASTQAVNVATQICALETATSPGYSTTRKPVQIHCIAFGTLFEAAGDPADRADALAILQQLQFIGGKAGGEQTALATPLASYKQITGTPTQRVDKLQQAFSRIMQDGVQVSLIR